METLSELRRSTTDGRIAGVCVMLADRWRVDPLLVRVAALLLALSSGIGLVLYVSAWALIPSQGSDRAPIDSVWPGARKLGVKAGVALLVVVCVVAASLLTPLAPFGIGPALVIGAVWYFGWYRPQQRLPARSPQPSEMPHKPFTDHTPFTQAAALWQQRVQEYRQQHPDQQPLTPPTSTPSPAQDPGYSLQAFLTHPDPVGLYPPNSTQQSNSVEEAAHRKETAQDTAPAEDSPQQATGPQNLSSRRRTGRMHLIGWSLLVVCVGTVAALDMSYTVPWFAYPAAALLAVGLALVVGAWLPRPRGLVTIGALLAVVIGISTAPLPQVPTMAYATVTDLPAAAVQHDAGDVRADLSALDLVADATYAVQVDAGRVTVLVPRDTNVRVIWSVAAGGASIGEVTRAVGLSVSDTTLLPGASPDGPTLTVEAHVGVGGLEVTR